MKTHAFTHALLLGGLAVLIAFPANALAQDKPAEKPPVQIELPEGLEGAEPEGDTPLKILERIGETLKGVESLMAKLSFGTETRQGQEKILDDIDKLLKQTGNQQQSIIDDIDKLIDMAQQQCKSGNFNSNSLQQPQQQQNQQPQQNKPQQQGEKQDQKSKLDPQNSEKPNGGEKETPTKSESEPTSASKPNDPAAEKSWAKDVNGAWGSLPPKLQELIRQGDPSKFPPQYRQLLEEYYKRLSDSDT